MDVRRLPRRHHSRLVRETLHPAHRAIALTAYPFASRAAPRGRRRFPRARLLKPRVDARNQRSPRPDVTRFGARDAADSRQGV